MNYNIFAVKKIHRETSYDAICSDLDPKLCDGKFGNNLQVGKCDYGSTIDSVPVHKIQAWNMQLQVCRGPALTGT